VPSDPILQGEGLRRRDRRNGAWLLEDVSISLRAGESAGVVGPSGAGKTLLLRALALLDPLDSGRVLWRGREVAAERIPAYRRAVMYLHQQPRLLENFVEAELRRPFALKASAGKEFNTRRVIEWFEELGRDASFLSKRSADLSGGEAQLVALVRGLQLDPEVLLLDEPTAALDVETGRAVERFLARWSGGGRAALWVSHNEAQVQRVTSRVVKMSGGRLI